MPDGEDREDVRVWLGNVAEGSESDHEAFVTWLKGAEAHEVYRRRRLNEYLLLQEGSALRVVFRAPHTGDPRIMIDFLRYPGMWPSFWRFDRGGGTEEAPTVDAGDPRVRVLWRRQDTEER